MQLSFGIQPNDFMEQLLFCLGLPLSTSIIASATSSQKPTSNPSTTKVPAPDYSLQKSKIKSSLYSPYYAEACDEWRGPFPRLSAWAIRRNVATVASRWQHCVDLTGPGIEPQTSRTDSKRFAYELTAGHYSLCINNYGICMDAGSSECPEEKALLKRLCGSSDKICCVDSKSL